MELSILIPAYNYCCTEMVASLVSQIPQGVAVEIIVAEDGSTDKAALEGNTAIAAMPHCRYIVRKENVGRAAIRNFLAQQSRHQWLLFMDCDMQIADNRFLARYIEACSLCPVIDGGIDVAEQPALEKTSLRYRYERAERSRHSAEQRGQNPYRSFRTTNFVISREVMLAHPFDERFVHYGYEDVLFGKKLWQEGIGIAHIDNPTVLVDLETNPVFVAKTEESLRTLYCFRQDLRGYSRLLTALEGIHIGAVKGLIRVAYRLLGSPMRRNLCGRRPSLLLFKLYKAGYYLALEQNKRPNA